MLLALDDLADAHDRHPVEGSERTSSGAPLPT
jgi:hypothetical protein